MGRRIPPPEESDGFPGSYPGYHEWRESWLRRAQVLTGTSEAGAESVVASLIRARQRQSGVTRRNFFSPYPLKRKRP